MPDISIPPSLWLWFPLISYHQRIPLQHCRHCCNSCKYNKLEQPYSTKNMKRKKISETWKYICIIDFCQKRDCRNNFIISSLQFQPVMLTKQSGYSMLSNKTQEKYHTISVNVKHRNITVDMLVGNCECWVVPKGSIFT